MLYPKPCYNEPCYKEVQVYMYIAPEQGQTTPWGQMLMSTGSPYHFAHLLQAFKTISWKSDFIHVFSCFSTCIYTTPWGQTFDVNRKPLSLCPFVARLKKEIWFYTHFKWFYICIQPRGQGQTTPWEQTFGVNRKPLSPCPSVAGLKKNCFEVPFYIHLFHVSPYVYSSRQGQTIHWGQNFDDNRKAFSLCPYVASFKMISSKSDFIHIF